MTSIPTFNVLSSSQTGNKIATSLYATALEIKDNCLRDDAQARESMKKYETLKSFNSTGEKAKVEITRKKKDKEFNTYYDATESVNPRKFVNISQGAKAALICLLQRYLRECHAFYRDNGNVFPDESLLVSQVTNHARSRDSDAIAPLVLNAPEALNLARITKNTHKGFASAIFDLVKSCFGGDGNVSVVTKLLEAFNDFVRLVGVHLSINAYWGRNQVKTEHLMAALQTISYMVPDYAIPITAIRSVADEAALMEKSKPAKKPAGEKAPRRPSSSRKKKEKPQEEERASSDHEDEDDEISKNLDFAAKEEFDF